MIEIVEGHGVGAGKSYFVVTRALPYLAAGGSIYCVNFTLKWEACKKYVAARYGFELEDSQYNVISPDDVECIHEVTPQGTPECPVLIILDEVQQQLNARDWSEKKKRAMFDWLCQSRHDDNDLLFISQNAHNIDKQVARLVTHIYRVKNGASFSKLLLFFWPPFRNKFLVNRLDHTGRVQLDRIWLQKDKGIFGCYESKCMRGTHTRLQGVVERKQLKKVKRPMRPLAIIAIIVIIAGLIKGAAFIVETRKAGLARKPEMVLDKIEEPKGEEKKERSVLKASPVVKSEDCCGSYDIEREVLRGTDTQTYLRTDVATYKLREMSRRGYVTGIHGSVAKIAKPDGRTLFVVAEDKSVLPAPPDTSPVLEPLPEAAKKTVPAPEGVPSPERPGTTPSIEAMEQELTASLNRPIGNAVRKSGRRAISPGSEVNPEGGTQPAMSTGGASVTVRDSLGAVRKIR